MSGTSLDGLDIAHVEFSFGDTWTYNLKACQAINYPEELYSRLSSAGKLGGLELAKLDIAYGRWIGEATKIFMDFYRISPDLVVSHGHTIFHQPENGLTLQIGNGYEIRNATEVKTICDLRSKDVSLGGEGAPLVPIGDTLLFSEYDFCLNLGGFSNVSFDKDGSRIAYDICPVNTVLNHLAERLKMKYDTNGEVARKGSLIPDLLDQLNNLGFYFQVPPKSLGIEWVQKHIFPLLRNHPTENLLYTFCHHISDQIIRSLENHHSLTGTLQLLATGGGAKNNFLMELLKSNAPSNLKIDIPDITLIDFKEAIIFAFLGLLRSEGKVNTLRSVTGAVRDSSGGIIYD